MPNTPCTATGHPTASRRYAGILEIILRLEPPQLGLGAEPPGRSLVAFGEGQGLPPPVATDEQRRGSRTHPRSSRQDAWPCALDGEIAARRPRRAWRDRNGLRQDARRVPQHSRAIPER